MKLNDDEQQFFIGLLDDRVGGKFIRRIFTGEEWTGSQAQNIIVHRCNDDDE
jgi:hypothetical protein